HSARHSFTPQAFSWSSLAISASSACCFLVSDRRAMRIHLFSKRSHPSILKQHDRLPSTYSHPTTAKS
ncbi:MAG: hypothetical protein ACRCZS_29945, partial [Chroococcidiopsis sp.]